MNASEMNSMNATMRTWRTMPVAERRFHADMRDAVRNYVEYMDSCVKNESEMVDTENGNRTPAVTPDGVNVWYVSEFVDGHSIETLEVR